MNDTSHYLQGEELDFMRTVSARGAQAWLSATGLVTVVDELRRRETDVAQVPVPGLATLLDEITEAYTDAVNALDSAILRAELTPEVPLDFDRPTAVGRVSDRDRITEPQLPEPLVRIALEVIRAERRTRHIAQLVLGATSHSGGTDDVVRVESAAVAALAFPFSVVVPLADDGTELLGSDREELRIEVAGIICRMLVDWGGTVALSTAEGARIGLVVLGDRLDAWVRGLPAGVMLGSPWERDDAGTWRTAWESPITVREAAEAVTSVAFDALGIETALELEIEVSPNT